LLLLLTPMMRHSRQMEILSEVSPFLPDYFYGFVQNFQRSLREYLISWNPSLPSLWRNRFRNLCQLKQLRVSRLPDISWPYRIRSGFPWSENRSNNHLLDR